MTKFSTCNNGIPTYHIPNLTSFTQPKKTGIRLQMLLTEMVQRERGSYRRKTQLKLSETDF